MLPSLRWRDSNPRSRMAADLQSALVAAGEHLIIFLWNLVESNHVLRIFSPAHTPSLPKFHQRRLRDSNPWSVLPPSGFQDQCNRPALPNLQLMRKQKDSNLRSLAARHVSSVLVSTAHPYFHWISGAKVQCHSAAFLRNKKKVTKKDYYSLMIIDKLAFPISTKHKCPNELLITSNHSGILM